MRKLLFVVPFVLMAATAQAGLTRGLIVASNESPVENQSAPEKGSKAEQEIKPSAGQGAKRAPKPPVRKRETDEAKARRIASKFGITW